MSFLKEYYDYKQPKNIEESNCFDDNSFCRIVNKYQLIIGFLTNTNQFIRIYDNFSIFIYEFNPFIPPNATIFNSTIALPYWFVQVG